MGLNGKHARHFQNADGSRWLAFSLLVVTEEELRGRRVPFKKGLEARASDAGDLVATDEQTANFFPVMPEKRVVWKDTEEGRQLLGVTLHESQLARTPGSSDAAPPRTAVSRGWDDLFIQPGVVLLSAVTHLEGDRTFRWACGGALPRRAQQPERAEQCGLLRQGCPPWTTLNPRGAPWCTVLILWWRSAERRASQLHTKTCTWQPHRLRCVAHIRLERARGSGFS